MDASRVIVVGAGVAGLACGFRLMEAGADPSVLEREAEPGGWVRTQRVDGHLCERGPAALRGPGPEAALLDDLGLSQRRVEASPASRSRWILRAGRLLAAPLGPGALLRTPLLSGSEKLRLLAEPFVGRRKDAEDESVTDFFLRRFGSGGARLAEPIVSGVFAGDPDRLSLRSCFPQLDLWEREHGSVLRGAFAAGGSGKGLYTFEGGLETLPRALAAALGDRLVTASPVGSVEREDDGWRVEGLRCGSVVLATPPWISANLLRGVDAELAGLLAGIPDVPVAVISLSWPVEAFSAPPEGFGFLVPRDEGLRTLGCLFESSLFPVRAPEDRVLVRVMAGGAHHPEIAGEDPQDVARELEEEIRPLLGAREPARVLQAAVHPRCLPQYVLGHHRRLAAIEDRLSALPGLTLAGNGYRGVSVPDCLADGESAARDLLRRLERSGPATGSA